MDRLTEKRDGHNVIPLRKFGIENIPKFTLVEISDNTSFLYGDFANKLAAYEDTGLTPEEIEQMKERLAVDPSGSDKIDELEEAIGFIEFERDNLKAENAGLHALLDWIESEVRG